MDTKEYLSHYVDYSGLCIYEIFLKLLSRDTKALTITKLSAVSAASLSVTSSLDVSVPGHL